MATRWFKVKHEYDIKHQLFTFTFSNKERSSERNNHGRSMCESMHESGFRESRCNRRANLQHEQILCALEPLADKSRLLCFLQKISFDLPPLVKINAFGPV